VLATLPAGRAAGFGLGPGADRVDVTRESSGTQLAVAPHAALAVDPMIGVADGTEALDHRRARRSEALVFVASRFHVRRALLQARGGLGGTTWTLVCRRALGVVEAFWPPCAPRCRLGDGPGSSPRCGGQRG